MLCILLWMDHTAANRWTVLQEARIMRNLTIPNTWFSNYCTRMNSQFTLIILSDLKLEWAPGTSPDGSSIPENIFHGKIQFHANSVYGHSPWSYWDEFKYDPCITICILYLRRSWPTLHNRRQKGLLRTNLDLLKLVWRHNKILQNKTVHTMNYTLW